jgi:hypothetical protein
MLTLTQIQEKVASLLQRMKDASPLDYASIGIGFLIAILYFRIVFGGFQDLRDSFEESGGRWWPLGRAVLLNWGTLKLIIWAALSLGAGLLAHHQLPRMFPRWFH